MAGVLSTSSREVFLRFYGFYSWQTAGLNALTTEGYGGNGGKRQAATL